MDERVLQVEAQLAEARARTGDFPECSLRDGNTVYYGYPATRESLDELRAVCGRLKAAGALAILVGRYRQTGPANGYPTRYLTVRAVMTEGDW